MKKLLGIAFVGMMALGCGGGSKANPDTNNAANPPAAGTTDPNATQTPPPADPNAGQAAPAQQ
jgi:hypothetical protein